jgi:hypothetical protein
MGKEKFSQIYKSSSHQGTLGEYSQDTEWLPGTIFSGFLVCWTPDPREMSVSTFSTTMMQNLKFGEEIALH